jgi:hypothetical protein
VSGVIDEHQARECLQLGAADFMGKPVHLDRLGEVLTLLEPHALSRLAERQARPDRRQSPRARLSILLRLVEYSGRELEGHLIEVDVSGAKARLGFTPPDGGPPIEAIAMPVGVEPDSHAFTFVRQVERDAERLRALVRSTTSGARDAGPSSGSGA